METLGSSACVGNRSFNSINREIKESFIGKIT